MFIKKTIVLVLCICIAGAMAIAQQLETTEIIDSVVVDNFDGETTGWTVQASRFGDSNYIQSQTVSAWPQTVYGYSPQDALRSFGVRGGFQRRGHNYIEIIPPNGSVDLIGRVKTLEMWVWNTNRDYYVTAELQDYRGFYHTVQMGSIRHLGWKKISARIPVSIPQLNLRYSSGERLRLLKLILWTRPNEVVSDFRVYFDDLRTISDLYQVRVDGSELNEPSVIQEIWR